MNQKIQQGLLQPSSQNSAAGLASHNIAFCQYQYQPQNSHNDGFRQLEHNVGNRTSITMENHHQTLDAAFHHYPSRNDQAFAPQGQQSSIYGYQEGSQPQGQAKLNSSYQYTSMVLESNTPVQSVQTSVHCSPAKNMAIQVAHSGHMGTNIRNINQISPNQSVHMTTALPMSQIVPPGAPSGETHVTPRGTPYQVHSDVHHGVSQRMSPTVPTSASLAMAQASPAGQKIANQPNPNFLPMQQMSEVASRATNFIKDERISPQYGLNEVRSGPCSPPKSTFSSDSGSRKRARTESADDFDSTLQSLATNAGGFTLRELAYKIKLVESGDGDIGSNTFLASLSQSKDVKQDMPLQVFAVSWVQQSCEAFHSSVVPRNRIYARYVQLCANFNLSPLAPANFGKVLRILFPNLKTRRLGMRGKSKYHYCGIKLIGDQSQGGSPMSSYSSLGLDSPQSLNPHTPTLPCSPSVSNMLGTPFSSIQVQEHFQVVDLKYVPTLFSSIEMSMGNDSMNQPLNIPSIYPYLQKDQEVDYDIADTLHSLYKVHCTALFELLRYMQIDKMFGMFSPFTSTLTTPVFKLFISESTHEWVKSCDLVMYRSMLKMLTRLHLLIVPEEIMLPLKVVAREYIKNLSEALSNKFPRPFQMMKLGVARQFILILKRLLKCIETGVSAAKILSNLNEKSVMLNDWLQLDMHEIVMREVPCALENSETLIDILDTKLVKLFEDNSPVESPVLKPYAAFLFELPSKFSKLNPWLFSLVCSNLLTTCLREMSLSGARSFGSWWVVRCWVDEYLSWCLELGGFLYVEFRSEFEAHIKAEDYDQPLSANVSASVDTSGQESLKTAAFVDLLDGMHGEIKTGYNEGDWL